MKKNRVGNPLAKRVPRELLGEWRKYLVIFLFLSLTIGFVAGMYVANHSMLIATDRGAKLYHVEDGHFELKDEADEELLTAIASGEKADLRAWYLEEAKKEIDEKVEEESEKKLRETVEETLREEIEKNVRENAEASMREGVEAVLRETIAAQITEAAKAAVKEQTDPLVKAGMMTARQQEQTMEEAVTAALEENLEKTVAENLEQAVSEYLAENLEKTVSDYLTENLETMVSEHLEEALKEARESQEFLDAKEDARKEAYEEAEAEIDKKFDEQDAKKSKAQKEQEANFAVTPVRLYENFYRDLDEDADLDGEADGQVRIYAQNDEVNMASFLEGRAPNAPDEIAIDRMHADNNGLKVGDSIGVAGKEYKIVGLLAYVNYSTLYKSNRDLMFDALSFNVAMVTKEAWEKAGGRIHYCYAYTYEDRYRNEAEEKKKGDDFLSALLTQTVKAENDLEDFVPKYGNQAIQFAPNDMGSDKTMGGVLLYILIIVLAFIFALTISSTITKEASTIGTLRASGYTKGELIRHYMTMPVLVTLLAAIVGNVLGYTFFKNVVVDMYYNSYSLPAYQTVWYYEAFTKTTIVPVIIMFLVNLIVVSRMLRLSPLKFLRHDLKTSKRKKAVRLPKFSFFHRFRLRVMLQNFPNYLVLLLGIYFVTFLLTFAFGLPSTLKNYQDSAVDEMFAKYQYLLKTTEDEDGNELDPGVSGAERVSMSSLESASGVKIGESVSVYGIESGSRYVPLSEGVEGSKVMISSAYADKLKVRVGDQITLREKYSGEEHALLVAGIYDYVGGIAVFMELNAYNEIFGYPEGSFGGYLSNEEITEIDPKYIAVTITEEDITKISRQLDHSMGGYMNYFKVACLLFAAILMYLLTKVIIEKNENAISMVKILGYENREIASLYLTSTTVVVILSAILSTFLASKTLILVWEFILMEKDGWLPAYIDPASYLGIIAIVIMAYLIIMFFDYQRIRRVPMEEALKSVE